VSRPLIPKITNFDKANLWEEMNDSYTQELKCKFEIHTLTEDHKCEIDQEMRRIYQHGGRIEKAKISPGMASVGPLRVWLRNEDRPGLAMTRSIGDHMAREIGVIATPDVGDRHDISERDYGVLIASDGVFEVLNHSKIANI